MKRAYTNGILLDGTEQMEPVRGKVLLTENERSPPLQMRV